MSHYVFLRADILWYEQTIFTVDWKMQWPISPRLFSIVIMYDYVNTFSTWKQVIHIVQADA